jgi:hypothetical protein
LRQAAWRRQREILLPWTDSVAEATKEMANVRFSALGWGQPPPISSSLAQPVRDIARRVRAALLYNLQLSLQYLYPVDALSVSHNCTGLL